MSDVSMVSLSIVTIRDLSYICKRYLSNQPLVTSAFFPRYRTVASGVYSYS